MPFGEWVFNSLSFDTLDAASTFLITTRGNQKTRRCIIELSPLYITRGVDKWIVSWEVWREIEWRETE